MARTEDADAPWEQMNGEPARWFARFNTYRLLGAQRSLLRAARAEQAKSEPTGARPAAHVAGAWLRAAQKWQWQARAQAWDAHLLAREEARWEKRRKRQREAEWKAAQDLLAKAKQMLAWPLARQEKKDEDGRQTTVVTPARWGMRDSASFYETASKLARLAADMATSKEKHEVGGSIEIKRPFDLEKLSDDELAALLANLRAVSDGDGGAGAPGAAPAGDRGRRSTDLDDEIPDHAVA